MIRIGVMLLPLLLVPQDDRVQAVRDYVTGESDRKPDLEGLGWKELKKDLDDWKFPRPENTGEEQSRTHTLANGHEATFYYYVPASYDPGHPAPLVFFLHGGVSAPQPKRGRGQWRVWQREADKFGWIACSPSGDSQCLWWRPDGEEHILEAIRFLSARYNVDRNRVAVSGFSDGASGAYCLGMRLTDNWAACIPWNGAVGVITSPRAGNTPFYTVNCAGTAWRATHGSVDQLYPSASQKPVIEQMKEAGVKIEWKNFEGVGHDGRTILRDDRKFIDEWLPKQIREPLPRTVDWTTHDPALYGRAFWIRIRELGETGENGFKGDKDFTFPVGQAGPPRPMLGVQLDQRYSGDGIRVSEVVEGSGAEEAGMKPGDVILEANESEIGSLDDLRGVLSRCRSGDKIDMLVKRDDEEIELKVTFRPVKTKPGDGPPDHRKAGRILAERDGNQVRVKANRVTRFEILVSPEAFDLSQDIVVTVNEKELHRGIVKPDVGVMVEEMRARKGDTTVAFVARIVIDVPKNKKKEY